jgi:hypothetical protein
VRILSGSRVQNTGMNQTGIVVILANLFAFGMVWWHHRSCRNSLNAWAKNENLTLLEVRYSWPFRGPDAWRRSRNQMQYKIKAWDVRGRILRGWVTLGTYWGWSWYTISDVT